MDYSTKLDTFDTDRKDPTKNIVRVSSVEENREKKFTQFCSVSVFECAWNKLPKRFVIRERAKSNNYDPLCSAV